MNASYWKERYRRGRTSGAGSRGHLAEFKAETVNRRIRRHIPQIIADYGCGDGHVAGLFELPDDCVYYGYDPALSVLRDQWAWASENIRLVDDAALVPPADLVLSLDVVLHLTGDGEYHAHMASLFRPDNRLILIYGPNGGEQPEPRAPHVLFRDFVAWVSAERSSRRLIAKIDNPYPFKGDYENESFSDFYLFA